MRIKNTTMQNAVNMYFTTPSPKIPPTNVPIKNIKIRPKKRVVSKPFTTVIAAFVLFGTTPAEISSFIFIPPVIIRL